MAQRPIFWRGYQQLPLVTCPVAMYAANQIMIAASPVIYVAGTANGAASTGVATPAIIAAMSRAAPAARARPSGP
jgi:hypothetical protein